jgi:hypothetical protein
MMENHKENIGENQSQNNKQPNLKEGIRAQLMEKMGWSFGNADKASDVTIGLLTSGGVWHKKIAQGIISEHLTWSEIRRIQRFFETMVIDYKAFGKMICSMLALGYKVRIILDRTNWKFGKKNINIFVATVICDNFESKQSFAVPIVWEMLEKQGISNTAERKTIMQQVMDIVGRDNIEVVMGDREFIGEEWISFLLDEMLPFIMRIRGSIYVEYKGKKALVKTLCKDLRIGEKREWIVKLNGKKIRLAATLSKDGELVAVIASLDVQGSLLTEYRLRWLIELFFKSIKSRGFNIEETHMTDPSKIKVLFAMLAYATALSVQAGIVRDYFDPIEIKNHGRPTYSLFTYGFDVIREMMRGAIPRFMTQIRRIRHLLPNCPFLPQNEVANYSLSCQ